MSLLATIAILYSIGAVVWLLFWCTCLDPRSGLNKQRLAARMLLGTPFWLLLCLFFCGLGIVCVWRLAMTKVDNDLED
jgi:hypothetical protein